MSFSRFSRRGVASIALVSYLLAATVSGMFHNHGGDGRCGDGCRTADKCARPADRQTAARSSHSHRHDHPASGHIHHAHAGHPPHHHQAGEDGDGSKSPPRHHGPLRHADCAACQFLVQQSVTTPQVRLVVTADVVSAVSETAPPAVATAIADAYPARGPPHAT